jgi:sec-independent protein translocase protein TatC
MALVPFPSQSAQRRPDDEPDWDEGPDDGSGGKMSFLEHLDELRKRIIWSVSALGVGVLIAFAYIGNIFEFIMRPMQRMLPPGQTLIYTDPSEAFMLQIKIALIAGLIVASPMVFAQIWLFIAPGLYQHEKKLAIPFVVMSTVLFVSGAAFSHYAVFPLVWRFFASFTTDYLTYMPRVEPAFSIYLRLILALGITFQLPTVVLFLARMGMITPRFMIRNFKYAILLIIIAAAVLSPDGGGVGMVVMGAPVVILYILSIGLAWMFGKRRRTDDDAAEA